MKRFSVNLLVPAAVLFLNWQATAETPSSTTALEGLVVTGTRTPKAEEGGPVRTEVITADDLKERQYRDAGEALMDIPGVTLVESTGKEGKSAVMQGLGGEHVLVLVDGAPLMQNASSGVDLTHVPAADIERIEVVKGGASALYGGQAMGGVINVITKTPSKKVRYEAELGRDQALEGAAPGGRVPYSLVKGFVSGSAGDTGLKLSVNQRKAKSIDRDAATLSRDTPDLDRLNVDVTAEKPVGARQKLRLDAGYNKDKTRSYTARLQPDASFSATTNDGDVERGRLRLSHEVRFDKDTRLASFLLTERTKDLLSLEDDPRTAPQESLKTSNFARDRFETQFDFSPAAAQLTTLGLVAEANRLDQVNDTYAGPGTNLRTVEVDGKTASSLELYGQHDLILDESEWLAGLRVTHDPAFGQHLDPKLTYMRQLSLFEGWDSRLRVSAGTGYRIPNLKERFYVLDHRAFAGYIVYGSADLRPEESLSYQAGLELARGRELTLATNLFVNQVKGLILSIEEATGTSERVFRFRNLNEALIYGAETSLTWQANSRLKITPSFTYTKATDPATGLTVPNRPFYSGQLNLRYDVGARGSNLSASLRYIGDSYGDLPNTEMYRGYTLADLRYNHRVDDNLEVYAGVKNLLDQKRDPRPDTADIIYDQRPEEGRLVVVGLRLEGT